MTAMKYDLTKGPVFRTISLFALPMLLGNMLQQLYNVVDTWVVGQYVNSDALAAVGSAFALMTFLTSVIIGLCMGCGVLFSLCFGKHEEDALMRSAGTSFLLIAAVTFVLTVGSLAGVNGIIRFLHIPLEIQALIRIYLLIVFCGIPAVFLYNFFASYLKALGNSMTPLLFLGISTLGVQYLRIEGSFYCGIGALFLFYGLYRAVGVPQMSLVLTVISLGTRVALAAISTYTSIGVVGIWWAVPIGWVLADLTGLVYLLRHRELLR